MTKRIELLPNGRIGYYEFYENEPKKCFDRGIQCCGTIEKCQLLNSRCGLYDHDYQSYTISLKSAKNNVVYFKPKEVDVIIDLFYKSGNPMRVGKPYPIPDGYEVMIEDKYHAPQKDGLDYKYEDGTILWGTWASRLEQWEKINEQYAILVPNEKTKDEKDREIINMVFPYKDDKQKSIEEAAKKYADSFSDFPDDIPWQCYYDGFIAGAKSQDDK